MGKINLLDSSVFNRIAAGEVVERPCSIVKELVENSIDAGADMISIEVKDGGLSYIRITDNGCGIDADDLERAFMPHATSKIKCISDLNSITTLGFRGEALTSIASVAKVTLISRTSDAQVGNYIVIENGTITEKGEKGCSYGTCVIVENLFKNIPARAKFLSKPSVEEAVITDMVSRLIMTNSTKSIKYSVGNKAVFQSSGDGLQNAVYAVYGKTFIDNIVPIEYVMPDITIKGFVNKPYFTKPNRTYQTLIVNGRYVINSDISYCVYNCYRDYLMKRQFPVFVLNIEIPYDMIDVNVHPNKLEIKFADVDTVKRIVYKTIKNKIDKLTLIPKVIAKNSADDADTSHIERFDTKEIKPTGTQAKQLSLGTFFALKSESQNVKINSPISESFDYSIKSSVIENNNLSVLESNRQMDSMQYNSENAIKPEQFSDNPDSEFYEQKFKTILFETYIVLEQDDSVLLIDQHAAHERVLYDKLINSYENRKIYSQNMLVPYIFTVTPIEDELLKSKLDEINSCGFVITELSGRTYSLSSVPLICAGLKNEHFVALILDGLNRLKYKKSDFVKDILMQSACKAAVKGDSRLDDTEISYLLKQYNLNNRVLLCPHGRPLIVKITKSEIEKWFKRTV
ncbi:MAG: DNA mismatch repair endonuclease MutL [Clostridia bacterium]|nr:DNA mismatch repair endonuclease MutL [Clostridia bacterium]